MMNMKKANGFTLIEMLVALMVVAVMLPVAYRLWLTGFVAYQQGQAADQLRQVNAAANAYTKRHFETLLASASATGGPQITIDQLINDSLLPTGFRNSNIWGQSYEIYVRSPRQNSLDTITITRGGREHVDGDSFATMTVPGAAMRLGGAGGFVPTGALPGQHCTAQRVALSLISPHSA